MASCSGVVFALDRATGTVRWSYDAHAPGQLHGNGALVGGSLIMGTDSGGRDLFALDAKSGRELWKVDAGGVESDLVVAGDRVLGVATNGDLIAVEVKSGRLLWRSAPQGKPLLPLRGLRPAVLGDAVFFGGSDGHAYKIDAATGKLSWQSDLGCRIVTPVVIAGGDLFVGGADGRLVRLDSATGAVVTTAALGGRPFALSVSAGLVLVLVEEKRLLALDLQLRERWNRAVTSPWSTPRLLILGEKVVAGSEDGTLVAFRMRDGSPAGSRSFPDMPRGVAAAGSVLYVGTLSGVLCAVPAW